MNKHSRIVGLLAIILINAGLVYFFTSPDLALMGLAAAIVGAVGMGLFLSMNKDAMFNIVKRVKLPYMFSVVLLVVMALIIPVFIELLSSLRNHTFDLTADKRHTLADQSRQIVANLTQPVEAYVFSALGDPSFENLEELMGRYENAGKLFKSEMINPYADPRRVDEYGVTSLGTVVIKAGERTKKITSAKEADITNAIVEVTSDQQHVVYFLTGHGERDLENTEEEGYSNFKEALARDNYVTKELILAREGKVPADASVLVIAGPTRGFVDAEKMPLLDYINGGGRVLLLADLDTPQEVIDFFQTFGISSPRELVIDMSIFAQLSGSGAAPIITEFGYHAIVRNFNFNPQFILARPMMSGQGSERIQVTQLVLTSKESWGETDFDGQDQVRYEEAEDRAGPISLGVASEINLDAPPEEPVDPDVPSPEEQPSRKARLAAFGDADFLSNSYFAYPGNGDLALNSISWLAENENLIAIRPRDDKGEPLFLTVAQKRLVSVMSLILIPLNVILLGFLVIIPRRRAA